MTINRKNNGYSDRRCTYENQDMHRELLEWEWMRTWTTNEQCAIIKDGSVYNKEHKTYHMHHQTEIKIVRGRTGFFEIYWKIGVLEII